MAINIKFDLAGNPELPTIVLANRNGNKLGQLNINADSVNLVDRFNDFSEFTFTINKYIDGELNNLWDKIVNFKLVYCKEWDNMWFEIKVEIDEETETVKTVFCTQLGQAELSQLMLYDIEINTEEDIARDNYKISVLYNDIDREASIIHRLLRDKAPHYINNVHVYGDIANIQRSFSFNDISIYDAFQEIAEEIGCVFIFPSNSDEDNNGRPRRSIEVYDLQQNCNNEDCKYRGEFTDKCPKCGSTNITYGYGTDTAIFVTSDELASAGIQLVTDTDSVKNCFKLEAGDDLMTATIRNCNPNGTDYIWRFSDVMKDDMSDELVEKIETYDEIYQTYMNDYTIDMILGMGAVLAAENTSFISGYKYVGKTILIKYPVATGLELRITQTPLPPTTFQIRPLPFQTGWGIYRWSASSGSVTTMLNGSYYDTDFYVEDDNILSSTSSIDKDKITSYNELVDKYQTYYQAQYKKELQKIPNKIIGYPALMQTYYNIIDLELYLKSGLMPDASIDDTSAITEADKLSREFPFRIAVANAESTSKATADSAALAMAKSIVRSTYRVNVESSTLSGSGSSKTWSGTFSIENYSDEEDVATVSISGKGITDDLEWFVEQKIEKALSKEDTEDLSVAGLFKMQNGVSGMEFVMSDNEFKEALQKYALNPLTSFHDACQACLDILIEQGIANREGWQSNEQNASSNLYERLYLPYYNRLKYIEAEMKLREDEIAIIAGVYDKSDILISKGLRANIEDCKNEIQDALNFQKYLGEELWLEFCSYRREYKYSNENYISDGLDNAELFNRALEFIDVAENEIYKSSELQHSISTTLNNLLAIPKFESIVDLFEVGNWIRLQIDGEIYKLRLLEYEIDFGDFDNISVEFSDVSKIKNGITDVNDVLEQASSMASSYDSVQRQASQGNDAQNMIGKWLTEGLNSALVQIQSNDTEEITLTKNGLLGRSYNDVTESYSPKQIKITHNILAYTDDDWESVKLALGEHTYMDYDTELETFIRTTGYGLSADFVTAGVVTGSKIIGGDIYSSNYSESPQQVYDKDGNPVVDENGNNKYAPQGSYINLIDGTFNFGGGALRFEIDDNGDGSLFISTDGISDKVTEITKNTITTEYINANISYFDAAKITGTLKAAYIDADHINAGTLEGYEIKGSEIRGGYLFIGDESENGAYTEISNGGHLRCNAINISGGYLKIGDDTGTYVEILPEGLMRCRGIIIQDGELDMQTVGEDGIIEKSVTITRDGTLTCNNAYINGTLTACEMNGGTINGARFQSIDNSFNDGIIIEDNNQYFYNTDALIGQFTAGEGFLSLSAMSGADLYINSDRDIYINGIEITQFIRNCV